MDISTLFPVTVSELEHSLVYAQTIQNGLLPKQRHFNKFFSDYFVLYQPQNTIGGDFYWLTSKNDTVYFAMADCTGHGVSGAMLSVLGISLLNYVIQKNYSDVGDYLTELDKKWIETFNNELHDSQFNNDWMEITLVAFNTKTRQLQYASASGEFAICTGKEIRLLKGNSFPVGGWQMETNRRFETFTLDLKSDIRLYFFSDGFKHQFDSTNTRKFSKKQLLHSLASYSHKPMSEQQEIMEIILNSWKENTRQTDDISLVGLLL